MDNEDRNLSSVESESPLNALVGIHDTDLCNCALCAWARNTVEQREYYAWGVEAELEGFRAKYGDEALAQTVDRFMTQRAIY